MTEEVKEDISNEQVKKILDRNQEELEEERFNLEHLDRMINTGLKLKHRRELRQHKTLKKQTEGKIETIEKEVVLLEKKLGGNK